MIVDYLLFGIMASSNGTVFALQHFPLPLSSSFQSSSNKRQWYFVAQWRVVPFKRWQSRRKAFLLLSLISALLHASIGQYGHLWGYLPLIIRSVLSFHCLFTIPLPCSWWETTVLVFSLSIISPKRKWVCISNCFLIDRVGGNRVNPTCTTGSG